MTALALAAAVAVTVVAGGAARAEDGMRRVEAVKVRRSPGR